MSTRSLALIGLLCLGSAATVYTPPVEAGAYVGLDINVAPPAAQYEAVGAVRPGFVWAPGYWQWDPNVHHHVWIAGSYIPERNGYYWIAPAWVQGPHGGWHFRQGRWQARR